MANDMNYFGIGTPDPEASKAFYGTVFDWRFGELSMPARYGTIGENRGGLWDTSHMGAENWAIFYVQVDDVHAAVDRAQQLGATVAVREIDNGMIDFAHLTDPLGNRFGSRPQPVGAENSARPAQAASRYSWMRPPGSSVRRSRARPTSPTSTGVVSSADGARWSRKR